MIAVTGANGYVGGRILAHLRAHGADALAFVRRPAVGDGRARRYALAEPLDASALDGVEVVVHAAYDLSVRGAEVRRVNCAGSMALLDAVAARGGRVVLISSLSAFDGARSDYGRAKLELEHAVLERGGDAVRPGLVFGALAGGLFGSLSAAIASRRAMPMVGGGWQRQFVTHDESLCELVAALAAGSVSAPGPLFAAHEVPSTLRALARDIARAHGHGLRVLPVPSALVYGGLRALELLRIPTEFRSDSLRSLSSTIPLDQVAALARSPVSFPPLRPELWLG